MSVNYYLHTKDMDLAFDLLPNVDMIREKRYFSIHVGQTSGVYKPDFEVHGDLRSWKTLRKFLIQNQDRFTIHDEYLRPTCMSDFIVQMEKLIKIGKTRPDDLGRREWWYDEDDCHFLNFEFS